MKFILPRRGRGRPTASAQAKYDADLKAFCAAILELDTGLDFKVGSRGWAYICEQHGLVTKGDFDRVQTLINDCRKSGMLPLDICLADDARAFNNVQQIDDTTPAEEAEDIVAYVHRAHLNYWPESFWKNQTYYVQCVVEKSTLKSMFNPECAEFYVPLATATGWSDINMRADMMARFAEWERKGKRCVLLYCGDHDPAGLRISDFLKSNMQDLAGAVGWSPDYIIIDRFGLNFDFIEEYGLTWIDGLETAGGDDLADPRHKDHHKSYVQDYLAQFGSRKVEGEALVKVPAIGRDLCRQAILKYVDPDAPADYLAELRAARNEVRERVVELINGGER